MRKKLVVIFMVIGTAILMNGCAGGSSRQGEETMAGGNGLKTESEEEDNVSGDSKTGESTEENPPEESGTKKDEVTADNKTEPAGAEKETNTTSAGKTVTDVKAESTDKNKAPVTVPSEGGSADPADKENSNIGSGGSNQNGSSVGSDSTEDVDKVAEANQNAAAQAGYYNIVSSSDGGYMVMVHDGEYDIGIQLLRDFLANMGCHAPNGMGGGWIDPEKDRYMCYVRGAAIVPLVTEEDEDFWN